MSFNQCKCPVCHAADIKGYAYVKYEETSTGYSPVYTVTKEEKKGEDLKDYSLLFNATPLEGCIDFKDAFCIGNKAH